MYFCGIDLAWSTRNGTGISILKGDKNCAEHISSDVLSSDEDILNYINETIGDEPAIITIDAPLIVPNEGESKELEKWLTFGFYDTFFARIIFLDSSLTIFSINFRRLRNFSSIKLS